MIEPTEVIEPIDVAPHAVLCFFQDVIETVVDEHDGRVVDHVICEIGRNPIYEVAIGCHRLTVVHPGVGAPLAAGFLEELIARGCRSFVACGGAGVLVPDVALGHVIVPTSAVRDEGTSYHYLEAGRPAEPAAAAVDAIETTLREHAVPYVAGVDLDHRCALSRDPGQGRAPSRSGMPDASRWKRPPSSPSRRSEA